MKIILPGGSGQVGSFLARAFHAEGHDVVVLSRTPAQAPWRVVTWDGRTVGAWAGEFEHADAVINLAGRSVNCRYNARNRRLIKESRLDSTRAVGAAIAAAAHPPRVWLQASTATIYAHRYDAPNDEIDGIVGLGAQQDAPDTWKFSIDVATSWERAANEMIVPRTRKVLLRSAIIMSPDAGGPFATLLGLVRRGLGGRNGDGRQMVSWVHDLDFIRAIHWLIEREDLSGPVNISAPAPLANAAFMRALREAWGTRIGLPSTKWMLEIGTFLLGTETELVLKSRYVIPRRLLDSGFTFQFPTWPAAAEDLCRRWKESAAKHPAPSLDTSGAG